MRDTARVAAILSTGVPLIKGETPPSTRLQQEWIYVPKEVEDKWFEDSWRLTWIGQLCRVLNKIASVEHR